MTDPRNAPPPLSPQEARLQRILKIVVAVLAVAILVVLGVLVSALIGGGADRESPREGARPEGPAVASFTERELRLPQGANIVETNLGDGLLAVRYRTEAGREEIALLDVMTGEMRGRIKVLAAP